MESFHLQINRTTERLLIFSLFVFGFIISYHRLQTGDIWWSLAEGRYIVEHGQLPTTNYFSYSNPDYPWETPQWLFSTLAFFVHQGAGITGLIVFRVIMVELLILILLNLFWTVNKSVFINCIGIIWILFSINFRLLLRAHLFSIVFFALTVLIASRPPKKYNYFAIFLLFIVWSNIHAGVLFGIVFLALDTLEKFIHILMANQINFFKTIRIIKSGILLLITGFLGALINPHFTQFIVYPYAHLNVNDLIVISEYMPTSYFGFDKMMYYWLTIPIFFLVVLIYLGREKKLPRFFLPALFFLLLSIKYNRIIPYFEISALVCMVATFPVKIINVWKNFRYRWILYLLFIYGLTIEPFNIISGDNRLMPSYNFGIGIDPTVLPVHATRFINKNPVPEPLFNDFFWGGYLIWNFYPERRTFIDGRIPSYPSEFVHQYNQMSWNRPDFLTADSLYNFQTLIIINPFSFHWIDSSPLDQNKWALVFWNSYRHFIYIKRNESNQAYIDKFEYKLYNRPYTPMGLIPLLHTNEDSLLAIKEIKRHNRWAPDPIDKYLLKYLGETDD
ncbi:MAG: hypothetical protein GXO90_11075 [FCB group bacterium]|nr:hypothetical protein [FCB group bacterium]